MSTKSINDDPGLILAYLRADQIWLSNYVYIREFSNFRIKQLVM